MAWSTPVAPVSGTVITVAWAVANIVTPVNWLRTMTGGADPPGTGYMVTSDSTTATSWKNGVAAILAVLGYTPANPAGFTMTGDLTFGAANKGVIFRGNLGVGPSGGHDIAGQGFVFNAHNDSFEVYDQALAFAAMFQVLRTGGIPVGRIGGQTIWHDGNTTNRVTQAAMADDSVGAAEIIAGSVGSSELASGASVANIGYTPARKTSGTYTGDGTNGRTIAAGFNSPTLVFVRKASNSSRFIIDSATNGVQLTTASGTVDGATARLTTGGFIVDASDGSNENLVAYSWQAFA